MDEDRTHEIQRMKQLLLQSALEWEGAQSQHSGTPRRSNWLKKVEAIADIETPEDAEWLLEAEDIDPSDWFIANEIDLVSAGLPLGNIDWSVIKNLGQEMARQSWSGGSWVHVYEYGGAYFVSNEVETTCFESLDVALESAGIGDETHDSIVECHTSYAATKARAREVQNTPAKTREAERKPGRAAIIVVTQWPSGPAAMGFGQALRKSLQVEGGVMTLLYAGKERIFRVVTPVGKEEFDESLAQTRARGSGRAEFIAL